MHVNSHTHKSVEMCNTTYIKLQHTCDTNFHSITTSMILEDFTHYFLAVHSPPARYIYIFSTLQHRFYPSRSWECARQVSSLYIKLCTTVFIRVWWTCWTGLWELSVNWCSSVYTIHNTTHLCPGARWSYSEFSHGCCVTLSSQFTGCQFDYPCAIPSKWQYYTGSHFA